MIREMLERLVICVMAISFMAVPNTPWIIGVVAAIALAHSALGIILIYLERMLYIDLELNR